MEKNIRYFQHRLNLRKQRQGRQRGKSLKIQVLTKANSDKLNDKNL